MFADIDKERIERMVGFVCLSPIFYGLLAWGLSGYRIDSGVNIREFINFGLAGAVCALLLSRLIQRGALPPDGVLTRSRIAGTCLFLAGIGEAISAFGAVAVWLGAPLASCAPFLIIGALYIVEFRFIRLPLILERWPEDK